MNSRVSWFAFFNGNERKTVMDRHIYSVGCTVIQCVFVLFCENCKNIFQRNVSRQILQYELCKIISDLEDFSRCHWKHGKSIPHSQLLKKWWERN